MSGAPELNRNQKLVLEALARTGTPRSAYELLDELRAEGLRAPLQVYRALSGLMERGLVHKLETVNAFVACSSTHGNGHGTVAFSICDRCGRVEEWTDEAFDRQLKRLSRRRAFEPSRTTIEMHGTCADCSAA